MIKNITLFILIFMFNLVSYAQETIYRADGSLLICPGVPTDYYVNTTGCNYVWTVKNGTFPTSNGGQISNGGKTLTTILNRVTIIWDNLDPAPVLGSGGWTVPAGEVNVSVNCGTTSSTGGLKVAIKSLKNVTPAAINGKTTETLPYCTNSLTLTVPKVSFPNTGTSLVSSTIYADSYRWTLPAGWSGPNGATGSFVTTANSIAITNNGCAAGGTVSVVAQTNCSMSGTNSNSTSITINRPTHTIVTNPANYTTSKCGDKTPVTFSITNPISCAGSYTWSLPAGWTPSSGTGTSITSTPSGTSTDAGNVTATTTLSCGTSVSASLPIGFNPTNPPATPVFSASTPKVICYNGTAAINVTSTGATSYEWEVTNGLLIGSATTATTTTGAITIKAPATGGGNATIKVRTFRGPNCGYSPWVSYSIWKGPPIYTGITFNGTITQTLTCANNTFYAIASGYPPNSTFEWSVTNGSIIYTADDMAYINAPAANQGITVKVRVSNICGPVDVWKTLTTVTSYNGQTCFDDGDPVGFVAYPNPSSSELNVFATRTSSTAKFQVQDSFIESEIVESDAKIQLVNKYNQVLWEGKMKKGKANLSTAKIPNGIYYLKIDDGKNPKTKQIVIQH